MPALEAENLPVSLSVVVRIADARGSTRVFEARQEQSFAVAPEALAALPGKLNCLVRRVGGDAQVKLSKFLELLLQPEPPAEAPPPPAEPNPSAGTPVPDAQPVPVPVPSPDAPMHVEDYLIPLALPLLS